MARSERTIPNPIKIVEHPDKQETVVTEASRPEGRKVRLEQFMKFKNMVGSGGQAKVLIQDGQVLVNGEVETRRKKQLQPGDTVSFGGQTLTVQEND